MALVTYHGTHPEPSLGWPDGCRVAAHVMRGRSIRNLSLVFPRGLPRETPALAALWLAGVRRREGPWFEIHFHKGEYQKLVDQALGDMGLGEWRAVRIIPRGRYRTVEEAYVLRAEDALLHTAESHARTFVNGCRAPYTVIGGEGERRHDPLA